MGEWDRGMALADKAIALSPTHPGWFHGAATLDHYHKGDYEAALAEAKLIQSPGLVWNFVILAMCCGQLGRAQEARAACDKLLELAPDFAEQAWMLLAAWNFPEDFSATNGRRPAQGRARIPDPAKAGGCPPLPGAEAVT